ncbi:uncharacterized protein [Drosophila kikkawai]|uniref:Salivary secreted peptide n=1 Tax=Drosophila kikkawai TaxID=30033 RepID=A0A6P4JIB5_DROKI|nr:uncharacterized protein LOC108083874 [Drosophila kikkawai]
MKTLQIVLVLSAIIAVAFAANASWGTKLSSSKLASTQNVTIHKKANVYADAKVVFPLDGQINTKIIRFISVTDRFTNSSGPTATLWSGGPGYTQATVQLKGQYAQGINATVQFYTDA